MWVDAVVQIRRPACFVWLVWWGLLGGRWWLELRRPASVGLAVSASLADDHHDPAVGRGSFGDPIALSVYRGRGGFEVGYVSVVDHLRYDDVCGGFLQGIPGHRFGVRVRQTCGRGTHRV